MGQAPLFRTGSITIDGLDLHEIGLSWWRSQIGLVQQEPFLFNDTIFKNVEYGLVGTIWEHETASRKGELVKWACKEAFANEFIIRLPDVSNFEHNLLLLSTEDQVGLRYPNWRRRNQTQWWSTTKASNRKKYREAAQNFNSR